MFTLSSSLRPKAGKNHNLALTCAMVALLLICLSAESWAVSTIKIATLAPDGSAWMNAVSAAAQTIEKQTDGRVKFKFYPGGVLGDEAIIIKKIRLGQIDGALLSSGGLATINPDIGVTEVPFMFGGYDEADYLMREMGSEFEKGMRENGFTLLAWTEAGFIYLMSEKPITAYDQIKGLKVWVWKDSQVPMSFFEKLGLSAVSLQVTDVLVALQSGLVDVVYNSPLGAVAMQWFTKIKYITKLQLAYSIAGLVVKNKTFEQLSQEDRQTVKQTFTTAFKALSQKTRQDNDQALEIMQKEGVQIITPPEAEVEKFREVSSKALASIENRVVPQETLNRAMNLMKEYRKSKAGTK